MPTPKLQNAFRSASDTEDIADLMLVTTTLGAVTADAGVSALVFNNGVSDVLVSATNRLPVDGSGATQPVSAAALPLPTGAATAAKQPALGSAGAAAADVITVQGIAAMTPLKVDGSAVTQPVSAASLPLPAGAATLAEQQAQTTNLAAIKTSVEFFDNTVGAEGTPAPAWLQAWGVKSGSNIEYPYAISSTALSSHDRLTLSAYHLEVAARCSMWDGAGWDLMIGDSINGLTVNLGANNDVSQSGVWTVQPGNTANTVPWLTNDRPATSGGLTMHKTISAASTNATSVKAAAGQVYAIEVFNLNASPRYLKLYNKASAPTVGTDTPVKTLLIPGNTAGGGVVKGWDKGLEFAAGIAFALTTGISDADTGAVAANEIAVNIDYK